MFFEGAVKNRTWICGVSLKMRPIKKDHASKLKEAVCPEHLIISFQLFGDKGKTEGCDDEGDRRVAKKEKATSEESTLLLLMAEYGRCSRVNRVFTENQSRLGIFGGEIELRPRSTIPFCPLASYELVRLDFDNKLQND